MILIDPVTCLAAAIYFEARGEELGHQLMVAATVMNRVDSRRFPNDVCSVVKQKWQFSFLWDDVVDVVNDPQSWVKSEYWAKQVLERDLDFHYACHYAVKTVEKSWMKDMSRLVYGQHAFYEGGC
jgi:spore germination cell wall hydrolase CwlJ-like protein